MSLLSKTLQQRSHFPRGSHPSDRVKNIRRLAEFRLQRMGFSHDRAEYAVQEAFIRAEGRGLCCEHNSLSDKQYIRYILQISKNYLLNEIRHANHLYLIPIEEVAEVETALIIARSDSRMIASIQVRAALARLSETDARMLCLVGDGFSCEEIAELWHHSVEWSKKRIQRARKRFRAELNVEGYFFPSELIGGR